MGEAAVEPLIGYLTDDRHIVREMAADALGYFKNTRAVGPLILALYDNNDDIVYSSSNSLMKILKAGVYYVPLLALFHDRNSGFRDAEAVLNDAIQLGKATLTRLTTALTDENYSVRKEAALEIGDRWDSKVLESIIQDLKGTDLYIYAGATNAYLELGQSAVQPLVQALSDDDYRMRVWATRALRKIGDIRAVDPLREIQEDEHEEVRIEVGSAIEYIMSRYG